MSGELRRQDFTPDRLRPVVQLFADGLAKYDDHIRRVAGVPSHQNMKPLKSAMRDYGLGEMEMVGSHKWKFTPYETVLPDLTDPYTTEGVDDILVKARRIGAKAAVVILF